MKILALLFIALLGSPSIEAIEIRQFEDPLKAERYETLIAKLRCLVCQNQSLQDSDAELARDLRSEVYEIIQSGKSEKEAITFLTDRYGDFVLYDPPMKEITLFLWLGPLLFLLLGGLLAYLSLRHRQRQPLRNALCPEEKARLKQFQEDLKRPSPPHSNQAP